MSNRAANAYRSVDLESAPKQVIVDRLFARFLDDLQGARTAIAAKDVHGRATALDHALRIVGELQASLDHEAAPELCANLSALYDFVAQRIMEATCAMQATPLDAATRVMTELASAFKGARAK